MAERLIKWFTFSVGLMILPIILSLIFHGTFNLEIHFSDYTSELLFMAVTLAATSIGDVFELSKKGVNGIHITLMYLSLIFISLICVFIYEIPIIASALSLEVDLNLIDIFTVLGCISSFGIGVTCQVFLERIEGEN